MSAQNAGRKVLTYGTFDILHRGHVDFLEEAASYGDRLVVALASDRSAMLRKGEGRPVNTFEDRAKVLLALRTVDQVVEKPMGYSRLKWRQIMDMAEIISDVQPDVLFSAYDIKPSGLRDLTLGAMGIDFVLSSSYTTKNTSTTEIIQRIRRGGKAAS